MGQYWKPVLGTINGKRVTTYDVETTGSSDSWNGLKFMEHSYLRNEISMAVANAIYHKKKRLLWVGDYADENNFSKNGQLTLASPNSSATEPITKEVYGLPEKQFRYVNFDFTGKYLVNHDTKEYISFDEYIKDSDCEGWIVTPLSVLTMGNSDGGGGDFCPADNTTEELIGAWAWCVLSIEDEAPKNYTRTYAIFKDEAFVPRNETADV